MQAPSIRDFSMAAAGSGPTPGRPNSVRRGQTGCAAPQGCAARRGRGVRAQAGAPLAFMWHVMSRLRCSGTGLVSLKDASRVVTSGENSSFDCGQNQRRWREPGYRSEKKTIRNILTT